MAIEFRIVEHSLKPGTKLVEILYDGNVIGAIYPKEKGISVVSAHFSDKEVPPDFDGQVVMDDGKSSFPPIPSIEVSFKPRKYYFIGKRIVYIE